MVNRIRQGKTPLDLTRRELYMKEFCEFWRLYLQAFPVQERRTLEQQKVVMKNEKYTIKYIFEGDLFIGFYTVWDLEEFIFIEHLAIDESFRGKGYGYRIMKEIIEGVNKIIVLEVERPVTEIAKKRIQFYERLGFKLNPYEYEQPAYQNNLPPVPMFIMSFPNQLGNMEFKVVREKLYRIIYNKK